MSKNTSLAVIGVLVLLVVLGSLIWSWSKGNAPLAPSSQSPSAAPLITPTPTPSAAENVVTYTGAFAPQTLRIKVGDTVIFKNESNGGMWVASIPHPAHTNYSGFDALRPYSRGENYPFTFNRKGTWGYHNHLSPSAGGTIIVE